METFAYNPDATLYYFAFDRSTGYVYVSNGASSGAFADASWDTYDVAMTERGTSSGIYELAKSAGLSASVCYDIVIYEQAGASPAITDQMVGVGTLGPALTDLTVDGKTLQQALQIIAAAAIGKVSGAGTGTEVFVGMDGSTTRATVTVDVDGNRSGVTYG